MPGPNGAGHFVKMVHNGIEYGLMQAYAEGFDILKNANSEALPEDARFDLDLTDIAEVWRRGSVISSWLLDLTASALAADPKLDGFEGVVEDSGEGRWTIMAAIEEAVPADVLSAALYTRFRSRHDHTFAEKLLSAMRKGFGGHVEPKVEPQTAELMTRKAKASAMARPAADHGAPGRSVRLVIFGASGDLTHRLLLPALYNLAVAACCRKPSRSSASRAALSSSEAFRDDLAKSLPKFATRKIDESVSSGCSAASPMCRAISTTPRPTRKSARNWTASSASAAPRAIGCSIWRRRRPPSRRSAVISAIAVWRAKRTAPGGASSSRSRSASISPRRAR